MFGILDYFIIALLMVLLFVILYPKIYVRLSKNIKNITFEEAYKLINTKNDLLIIDVRTKEEYKAGHIKGARSFPVKELAARIKELNKYNKKSILIYCATGNRSIKAVNILLRYGFVSIYHMKHGLKDWDNRLK